MSDFFAALDARIARYDLLQHPFYQAWSKGELTRDELREYASEYWHHVSAFPTYLSALHARLEDAPLRRTVLENLADEEGLPAGRPHSDLWMDFAAGMGADSAAVRDRALQPETAALIAHFRSVDAGRAGIGAGRALHLRVARARHRAHQGRGVEAALRRRHGHRRYFTLHQIADVLPREGLARRNRSRTGRASGRDRRRRSTLQKQQQPRYGIRSAASSVSANRPAPPPES